MRGADDGLCPRAPGVQHRQSCAASESLAIHSGLCYGGCIQRSCFQTGLSIMHSVTYWMSSNVMRMISVLCFQGGCCLDAGYVGRVILGGRQHPGQHAWISQHHAAYACHLQCQCSQNAHTAGTRESQLPGQGMMDLKMQ